MATKTREQRKSDAVLVQVTPTTRAQLEELAFSRRVSLAEVVRGFIAEGMPDKASDTPRRDTP